jgi:hypothetical protein
MKDFYKNIFNHCLFDLLFLFAGNIALSQNYCEHWDTRTRDLLMCKNFNKENYHGM